MSASLSHRRSKSQRRAAPGPCSASTSPGLDSAHVFRLRQPQPMQPARLSRSRSQVQDAVVEVLAPAGRQPRPVLARRDAVGGQGGQRLADAGQRDAEPLRHPDERHAPQGLAGVAALVAGRCACW